MPVQTQELKVRRFFTRGEENIYATCKWGKRKASITQSSGEALFEQEIEAPDFWSDTAVNIAAYKYLRKRGVPPPEGRETSIKQLIGRVARTLARAGISLGYLTEENAKVFEDELTHILLYQKAAFNSPVWFNCGLFHEYGIEGKGRNFFYNLEKGKVEPLANSYEHPQCSACFIQLIEDSLESIFDTVNREALLFKYGSGTGTNFSPLRSRFELLAGGGVSSGLISFLKVFDSAAGAIKSGGTTRRAAKMVIVNIDHPEVEDFIWWKVREEEKAQTLIGAGYESDFNGEAYHTISGQNANNSVRVTDEFMKAYLEDGEWSTVLHTTGETHKTYKAKALMRAIAEAAWRCADPGMQYDTTINKWNTCKTSGRINASNPCSEYMFLDDSACNLASLNLLKFMREDGNFDLEGFCQAVDIILLAQEIIVDFASYPSKEIVENSHNFRALGLGYCNLGAYLMVSGLPYDSEEGRALAATLTALMTGKAYWMSARLAEFLGPFPKHQENKESMLEVIKMHREEAHNISAEHVPLELVEAAQKIWDEAVGMGERYGFRNAQVTLLAPTGTIGPLMDVDTTGVEPDFALVKYKKLAGGGGYPIVNQSVAPALRRLGYREEETKVIVDYILENSKIEGAPYLKEEHLPIFDCASHCGDGERLIEPIGHIKMMAAVQPFLSGAISKTVNMPEETIIEEIEKIYLEAWRRGLKALAIYRDNCKLSQPLSSGKEERKFKLAPLKTEKELPPVRQGVTHLFEVGTHKVYLTANTYEDGSLGEVFIRSSKEGSTFSGLLDTLARMISRMLQQGVPTEVVIKSLLNMRFEPWGATGNPEIPFAKSIPDYIGRWLGRYFLPRHIQEELGVVQLGEVVQALLPLSGGEEEETVSEGLGESTKSESPLKPQVVSDAPLCPNCGSIMVRSGSCYACPDCGNTSGCS